MTIITETITSTKTIEIDLEEIKINIDNNNELIPVYEEEIEYLIFVIPYLPEIEDLLQQRLDERMSDIVAFEHYNEENAKYFN